MQEEMAILRAWEAAGHQGVTVRREGMPTDGGGGSSLVFCISVGQVWYSVAINSF